MTVASGRDLRVGLRPAPSSVKDRRAAVAIRDVAMQENGQTTSIQTSTVTGIAAAAALHPFSTGDAARRSHALYPPSMGRMAPVM